MLHASTPRQTRAGDEMIWLPSTACTILVAVAGTLADWGLTAPGAHFCVSGVSALACYFVGAVCTPGLSGCWLHHAHAAGVHSRVWRRRCCAAALSNSWTVCKPRRAVPVDGAAACFAGWAWSCRSGTSQAAAGGSTRAAEELLTSHTSNCPCNHDPISAELCWVRAPRSGWCPCCAWAP
jgi:hypothetical protein